MLERMRESSLYGFTLLLDSYVGAMKTLGNCERERDALRSALGSAFDELDDILEDWQLHGRHDEPRYARLKAAVDATKAALAATGAIDTTADQNVKFKMQLSDTPTDWIVLDDESG